MLPFESAVGVKFEYSTDNDGSPSRNLGFESSNFIFKTGFKTEPVTLKMKTERESGCHVTASCVKLLLRSVSRNEPRSTDYILSL